MLWTCKADVNSGSGENWKEPSSSTISPEPSFNGDSSEDTLNVNKEYLVDNLKNKWDVKYIQILTAPAEGAAKNIREGLQKKIFITYKFTQRKTSRTSQIDVFKIPGNIRKLFSKCELIFFYQASSDQFWSISNNDTTIPHI